MIIFRSKLEKCFLLFCAVFTVYSGNIAYLQAQNPSITYLSPSPGSTLNLKETNIIIRYTHKLPAISYDISLSFHNEGSESGIHKGKAIVSDDYQTVIFKPDKTFEPGETVSAQIPEIIPVSAQKNIPIMKYSFKISREPKNLPFESIPHIFSGGSPPPLLSSCHSDHSRSASYAPRSFLLSPK